VKARVSPTLFDKLVADSPFDVARDGDGGRTGVEMGSARFYTVPRIERFNEAALRATLLRELGWLLNTTNLDAVQDLSAVPEVMTSTLNYGLGDLSGTLLTRNGVQARARDMREAIVRYEPRVERGSLEVEPSLERSRPNSVSFVIRGDVTAAVQAMPVEIRTDVEVDTGAASFGEG
jgi:type VI secretion system protein ImpF